MVTLIRNLRPPPSFGPTSLSHLELAQRLHLQAVRSLIEAIECECLATPMPDGTGWWDTRPMLHEREHSPEVLDLNREILDLAATLGVIVQHPAPALAHLVRVRPGACQA